jgi:hypothetical protein
MEKVGKPPLRETDNREAKDADSRGAAPVSAGIWAAAPASHKKLQHDSCFLATCPRVDIPTLGKYSRQRLCASPFV